MFGCDELQDHQDVEDGGDPLHLPGSAVRARANESCTAAIERGEQRTELESGDTELD